MTRILLGGGVLGLALTACTYSAPDLIDAPPPDAPVDAPTDAPFACAPDSIVCDDALGVYTDCAADGTIELQLACPLGCAANLEKCLDIDPSNGLAIYLDMVTDPPDLVLSGQSIIRTSSGGPALVIAGGETVDVPNFETADGIKVFVVRSLTVTGTTRFPAGQQESLPAAFLALGDVNIEGTLDLSADGPEGGPSFNSNPDCAGGSVLFPTSNPPDGGGGGGGGAEPGALPARPPAAGGAARNSAEPLLGGCGGGNVVRSWGQVDGGGPGGALQITSRTRIWISGAGLIDASGGGGTYFGTASSNIAGAGGGGGGTVLLEAPQVVLDGAAVVISTKGGGGAGAGTGAAHNGRDGNHDTTPAPGGASSLTSRGGNGGNGTIAPTRASDPQNISHDGGGGGGAAGLTVIRTASGAFLPQNGASILSKSQINRIRTRPIP